MHFIFNDTLGNDIYVYKWDNLENRKLKGIVQFVHGSMEHAGRYNHVATLLNKNGYIFYANDHPGHGKTLKDGQVLGDIIQYGTSGILENIVKLTSIIKKDYPNTPIFIMGHSWGSMLVKAVIENHGKCYKGALFTGVIDNVPFHSILKLIIKIFIKKGKKDDPCILWDFQMRRLLRKAVKNPDNKWDWLTRDENKVKEYMSDNRCAFIPPNGFMLHFLQLYNSTWMKKSEEKIPKNLPLYFFVGSNDDGNAENRIKKIAKRYNNIGILDITSKVYKDARHEPLNEVNRDIVLFDIVNWLNQQVT